MRALLCPDFLPLGGFSIDCKKLLETTSQQSSKWLYTKRGFRVQTQTKVGFMETLIYHMKNMECGAVGDVCSRVLELS